MLAGLVNLEGTHLANYSTDFGGRQVLPREVVAIVYYSGTLSYCCIERISENGKGVKVSLGDSRFPTESNISVSKWKRSDVLCKLKGDICPPGFCVDHNTGEIYRIHEN